MPNGYTNSNARARACVRACIHDMSLQLNHGPPASARHASGALCAPAPWSFCCAAAAAAAAQAEQDFAKITTAPAVAQVARAHGQQAAGVAISWVAQSRIPMVLISAKRAHMRDNLRVYSEPSWGRLSEQEMALLSAARQPPGRPAYWGDCDDNEHLFLSPHLMPPLGEGLATEL